MDGLDEYLNNPYEWAVLVVLDHIKSEEKSKQNEKFVNKLLNEGVYEFISTNFLEFDLPKPSKEKIVSEVMICLLEKKMKNYTAKKLLKLSTKKQKEWVEEQDWYKDENFEQKLHDAPVIGLSIAGLEEYVVEKMTNFQDHETIGILRDKKYITIKRADELESLGNFTEEEKEFVKDICIDEALDEDSVLQGRRLKINFDNQVLYIVFYGNYSSILGFNEFDFLGIYSNDEEAEKAMSTIGTPIENFLSNIDLSSTRDV